MEGSNLKITREELYKLIEEELNAVLDEGANPYHSKATGKFTDKSGEIYSLTKNATDNVKDMPIGRGRNKNGKPIAKYGLNTGSPEKQCGRKTFSGTDKKKTRSCSEYPKRYWSDDVDEELIEVVDDLVEPEALQGLAESLVAVSTLKMLFEASQAQARASKEGSRDELISKCRQMGFRTFDDILKAINNMARAGSGKLYEPSKKQ